MENSSKHQKLYRLIGLQIIGMLLGKKLDCSYVTRAFRESYIVGFRSKFTAIRREWQHWIEPLPILWQNCWEPNISISGSVSTQQSFFLFRFALLAKTANSRWLFAGIHLQLRLLVKFLSMPKLHPMMMLTVFAWPIDLHNYSACDSIPIPVYFLTFACHSNNAWAFQSASRNDV